MADLAVEMTGNPAALEKALAKAEGKILDLTARLKESGKAAGASAKQWEAMAQLEEKAFKETADAAKKAAADAEKQSREKFDSIGVSIKNAFDPRQLAGFVTGIASIGGAVRLIREEIEHVKRIEREAAQEQLAVEQSRADIVRNLPGASKEQVTDLLAKSRGLAAEQRIDERFINAAIASGLSASAGNVPGTMAAVGMASKFLANRPEDIPLYAGALLDLQKVTGSKNMQANLGYLSFLAGLSRVVAPQQKAANIPRALIGLKGWGATPAQAAAFYAALTSAAADPEGRESGTGSIGLAEQLAKFMPAAGRPGRVEGGLTAAEVASREANRRAADKARARLNAGQQLSESQLAALRREEQFAAKAATRKEVPAIPSGLTTFGARVEEMWRRPELVTEFLAGASFEKKVEAPIREFLTNRQSQIAREYLTNVAAIPGEAALIGIAQQQLENLTVDPAGRLGRLARGFETGAQRLALADPGATAGVIEDRLRTALERSGLGRTETWSRMLSYNWFRSGTPAERAIDVLEQRRGELMATTFAPAGPGGMAVPRTPSPLDREQAAILEGILTELKTLVTLNRGPTLGVSPEVDK